MPNTIARSAGLVRFAVSAPSGERAKRILATMRGPANTLVLILLAVAIVLPVSGSGGRGTVGGVTVPWKRTNVGLPAPWLTVEVRAKDTNLVAAGDPSNWRLVWSPWSPIRLGMDLAVVLLFGVLVVRVRRGGDGVAQMSVGMPLLILGVLAGMTGSKFATGGLLIPALYMSVLGMYLLAYRVAQPGQCAACGYSLRGLRSSRCPECGARTVEGGITDSGNGGDGA